MQFIDLQAQYRALKPDIDQAMHAVLDHGQYIIGPEVAQLENVLAQYIGVKHAITCANGTDALQLIYLAYGIGAEDVVFCPDITFVASMEPACMLGATPVFCDVESDTLNLCPESLERQIQAVQREGKLRPRAVVAMDFLGNPCDYEGLEAVCHKYGLLLIEDAAQSFGSEYQGTKCGSFGQAAITSFFPAKPLGCYGDGGAVFTNDDTIADTCRSMRVHGQGKSKYNNERIGINSRLDTLQAAILLVKLKAFEAYEIDARQRVATCYSDAFSGHFTLQRVKTGNRSAHAQYAILAKDRAQRDALMRHMSANAIPHMVYYPKPQHALPVFQNICAYDETFAVSNDFCERTLSLPMHPYLGEEEQEQIIRIVLEGLGQ